MVKTGQIYKFIEANRSLDKLITQDLEYSIKTAYNLIKTKNEIGKSVDYIMERFSLVCGNNVNFENLTDEQQTILNGILSQDIEIDIPEINANEIVLNDNVTASPSDVENILFLFGKNDQ